MREKKQQFLPSVIILESREGFLAAIVSWGGAVLQQAVLLVAAPEDNNAKWVSEYRYSYIGPGDITQLVSVFGWRTSVLQKAVMKKLKKGRILCEKPALK
jgi:hypothetical protein